MENLEDWIKKN